MTNTLGKRIEVAAARLSQLQARARLIEQAEKARTRKQEKRERAKSLASLMRTADAHRKIVLGGIVIAAGADNLDPAELCGWLLASIIQSGRSTELAAQARERGLQHFASRQTRSASASA
ncbi:MAG: conjugal transfer protein TraD [Acidobacteria bacterium]|nr:conjugal transfer protein TraD [Acidobacteriota bacterium]